MKESRFFKMIEKIKDFFHSFRNVPIDKSKAKKDMYERMHGEMLLLKPGDSGLYIYSEGMDGYPIGPYIFIGYEPEIRQVRITWTDKKYDVVHDAFLRRNIYDAEKIPAENIHTVPLSQINHFELGGTADVRIRKSREAFFQKEKN